MTLSNEAYVIHAYWGSRQVEVEPCAALLRDFVNALPNFDPIYDTWVNGWPRSRTFCSVPLGDEEAIGIVMRNRARYDLPKKLWPEMGYNFSAFHRGPNGLCADKEKLAGATIFVGRFGDLNTHANILEMLLARVRLATDAPWQASELRPLMKLVLKIWSPRELSVDCSRYAGFKPMVPDPSYASGKSLLCPWVGWLTYLPADLAAKVSIAKDLDVERLDDGSIIVSLCEEPFTIDNPEHMARARALETAIRHVQT